MNLSPLTFRANLKHKLVLPFDLGEFNYKRVIQYVRENPNALFQLAPVLPESRKQRRYFEGCLVALFVFYNGGDYHDSKVLADAREDLKNEFWSELRMNYITGKLEKKAKSTKGSKALNAVTEKVLEYLIENYAPPVESFDPVKYKYWRDVVLMNGGPENYLDYLLSVGIITRA